MLVLKAEFDEDSTFHTEALAEAFPSADQYDIRSGEELPDPATLEGVVITGSSAGVYETELHPEIENLLAFVRAAKAAKTPVLGVCFGHQLINAALGGTVEPGEPAHRLVQFNADADPLFSGVTPIITALHGDYVTEPGKDMRVIAQTDYCPIFGTRHETAPIWSIQGHPELEAKHRKQMAESMGWTATEFSFEQVNASRIFENFQRIVTEQALDQAT